MQIIMFLTLGLLVFPKQIIPFLGTGVLVSLILIVVARPLSVFISLIFFKLGIRKKIFISWVGLRGAVPIILATYPLTAGIDHANGIFNLVFFISVTSILIQGTGLPYVAKWLNLVVPESIKKKSILDMELNRESKSVFKTVLIEPGYACIGKSVVDLGLPGSVIITVIERDNKYFISDGSTKLLQGDNLHVIADDTTVLEKLYICLAKQNPSSLLN